MHNTVSIIVKILQLSKRVVVDNCCCQSAAIDLTLRNRLVFRALEYKVKWYVSSIAIKLILENETDPKRCVHKYSTETHILHE